MKRLLTATTFTLCLTGCVGVIVTAPDKTTQKTPAYHQLTAQSKTPVISRTVKSSAKREWCGVTLWAVIVPIPLQLPVCESYTEDAYGNDMNGFDRPLLYSSQTIASPFYACGPLMLLGPISHGYQGNFLCGVFP